MWVRFLEVLQKKKTKKGLRLKGKPIINAS